MRARSKSQNKSEQVEKAIRRATRKHHPAEEKIRTVPVELVGEDCIE